MPYCENCDKHYSLGTLFCPSCGLYLMEFKIHEGQGSWIRLQNIATIYKWANEMVSNGKINWEKLGNKAVLEIGCSEMKAKEYVEEVRKMTENEQLARRFERRYRMGMYD